MEFLALVGVGLVLVAGLGVAGYFILRRLFDRVADRVADRIGDDDRGSRGTCRQLAGRSSARRPLPGPRTARLTHLGAYARAERLSEDAARREFANRSSGLRG